MLSEKSTDFGVAPNFGVAPIGVRDPVELMPNPRISHYRGK
jgi:hypothetical protein